MRLVFRAFGVSASLAGLDLRAEVNYFLFQVADYSLEKHVKKSPLIGRAIPGRFHRRKYKSRPVIIVASVFTMSAHAVVPQLTPPEAEPIPFLSLPEPVHENIVRFVGGGGDDVPESYGASLIVLAGVMPYYDELVQRWFSARFITMLCVEKCFSLFSFQCLSTVAPSSLLPELFFSFSSSICCDSAHL